MNRVIILFILALSAKVVSLSAQEQVETCQWLNQPVDNITFNTYLDFFKYDRNVPFDLQIIDVKEEGGIRKEHLSFQSTQGVRVYANYFTPAVSESQKAPTIIFLHGGSASGKDSRYVLLSSTLYVRAGFNFLAIDMQYFGERATNLITTFTEKDKHEKLYNQLSIYLAWVTQTVKDVSRSFDLLVDHKNVDSKRIGFVGFSRGAEVGIIVGGAERRLAAIVSLHGGHFDRLERKHLPAACPANYIGRISPRPLLMINGSQDTDYVKETSVLPLQRLAQLPKHIRWTETGHGILTEEDHLIILQWLRENLK